MRQLVKMVLLCFVMAACWGQVSKKVKSVCVTDDAIFASTENGPSISTDGGKTWTNKSKFDGLGSDEVYGATVHESTVYVATAEGLSSGQICASNEWRDRDEE